MILASTGGQRWVQLSILQCTGQLSRPRCQQCQGWGPLYYIVYHLDPKLKQNHYTLCLLLAQCGISLLTKEPKHIWAPAIRWLWSEWCLKSLIGWGPRYPGQEEGDILYNYSMSTGIHLDKGPSHPCWVHWWKLLIARVRGKKWTNSVAGVSAVLHTL